MLTARAQHGESLSATSTESRVMPVASKAVPGSAAGYPQNYLYQGDRMTRQCVRLEDKIDLAIFRLGLRGELW